MKVAVIGAGPGGMQAALSAAEAGAAVTLIDENLAPGGQIWRKGPQAPNPRFSELHARLQAASVEYLLGHTVTDITRDQVWLEGPSARATSSRCDRLILATGGRELFLPFPGWTLPNVMGAGGLQAMVKSGLDVTGKRIVIAGSGPLLMAVAAYLKKSGAHLLCILEQARLEDLLGFAARLSPAKVWEGLRLAPRLAGVEFLTSAWVTRARGSEKLESVSFVTSSGERSLSCDYLATSYGLLANTELFSLLDVSFDQHFVAVDEHQQTSVSGVYAVGEATGIGGVDKALCEGQIAGLHAAGALVSPTLLRARDRHRSFVQAMERAFRPRAEVKALCENDTIICRCEDVSYGALKSCSDQRSAKLYTRCGMGACQGRICGSINRELFQWQGNRVRPPLLPVPMGRLYRQEAPL